MNINLSTLLSEGVSHSVVQAIEDRTFSLRVNDDLYNDWYRSISPADWYSPVLYHMMSSPQFFSHLKGALSKKGISIEKTQESLGIMGECTRWKVNYEDGQQGGCGCAEHI